MQFVERMIFRKAAPRQIKYLKTLDYANVDSLSAAVLGQLEEDFVVGPPLTLHMPNPRLFAAVWSIGRECLTIGREGRPLREAVAAAISQLNACPYCTDVHTSMLHSLGRSSVADAIRNSDGIDDPRIRAAVEWASATLTPGAPILMRPPFTPQEAPQILGTAICFHYINRMVNVFLESSPFPMKTGNGRLTRTMTRLFGGLLRDRLSAQDPVPGRFLTELPSKRPLPPEFQWATIKPNVAGALLRTAVAAEEAGEETVDPNVRRLVEAQVGHWNGEARGLSRQWAEDAITRLDEALRPSARLALLTALASYQVDDGVVSSFRQHQPSDRDLINITAWASYVAARRIAGWLKFQEGCSVG